MHFKNELQTLLGIINILYMPSINKITKANTVTQKIRYIYIRVSNCRYLRIYGIRSIKC